MKLIIDIDEETIEHAIEFQDLVYDKIITSVGKAIANGIPLKDKFIEFKKDFSSRYGLTDDFMVQKSSILWLIDRYIEGKENEYDDEYDDEYDEE